MTWRAPYEVCALLADDDTRAIGIMKHLNRALNLLDLRDLDSGAFAQSVRDAREYLRTEFYDGLLRPDRRHRSLRGPHAHRRGVAVEPCPNAGKGHPQLCQRGLPDGTLSRIHLYVQPAPALRFRQARLPALYERIRARVAQGRWEPGGRHVAGGRLQHVLGRKPGAPVFARQAGSSAMRSAVRTAFCGCRTPSASAARCRRS